MTITENIVLLKPTLGSVKIEPDAGEPKVTLAITADCTHELAHTLLAYTLVYDSNGLARGGFDAIDLDCDIGECKIKMHSPKDGGLNAYLAPKTVDRFKIVRKDGALKVQLKIVLDGYATAMADLANEVGEQEFSLEIQPSQMQLPLRVAPGEPAKDEDFLKELGIEGASADAA